MFKIALPIPSEFENDIPSFLAQMKIAIKATEKSYEQITKNLTDEQKQNFYIMYRHPKFEYWSKGGEDKLDKIDPNMDDRQKIELEINEA